MIPSNCFVVTTIFLYVRAGNIAFGYTVMDTPSDLEMEYECQWEIEDIPELDVFLPICKTKWPKFSTRSDIETILDANPHWLAYRFSFSVLRERFKLLPCSN